MRCSAHIIPAMTGHIKIVAASLLLAWLQITPSAGQDYFADDTVNISAITVTAAAASRYTPFSVTNIDSLTIARYSNDDLGTMLQHSTLLTVKRYGNHGLASVSMRGMSGSHTLVTWNGISITPPATGMSDFAIIPAMTSTSVTVVPGGGDLQEITGSIGGKIDLASEAASLPGTTASLSLSAGSYNDYTSSFIMRTGGEKISANLTMWGNKAKNDFIFTNNNDPSGPTKEQRTNSAAVTSGLISDIFFSLRRSSLSAHFWFSDADRQLPGPVTTVQQDFGEEQSDRSIRSAVKYSFSGSKLTADITGGQSFDINSYFNEAAGITGDNRSLIYTLRGRLGYRINDKIDFTLNAGDEYQRAISLSYDEGEVRNILSASLSARYSPATRIRLMMQARQMIIEGNAAIPEMTFGGSFLITDDGKNIIKASVSQNFKMPSLNDLYWSPGGNNSLRPERSVGGEAGYSFASISAGGSRKSLDITLHSSSVSDLIQWVPGASGLWSAENIRSVRVSGIEGRTALAIPFKNGTAAASLNYALTNSVVSASEIYNDKSVGRQLIYTPLHHVNAGAELLWHFIRIGCDAVYESKRFTASDNSEWLPPSLVADALIGTVISPRNSVMTVDLKVNNLFNAATESVSNYPMPLRTFTLRINVTIKTGKITGNR